MESPKRNGRRSRKSIAHVPSAEMVDRENVTIQALASDGKLSRANLRKMRSQSLGPGGLEALNESSGNRQKVMKTTPQGSDLLTI